MNKLGTTEARLPFEPRGRDFPYYRDHPPTVSMVGWFSVLAGVAAGFAALVTPLPFTDGILTAWLRVVAFLGLPLLGVAIAAPGRWKAIFGRVGLREVKLMFVFALLNIFLSMMIGGVINTLGTATANPAIANASQLDGASLFHFFAKVAPQLLGEELITILPFLAVLRFCHAKARLSRNVSVIAAWLITAVGFGLIHLPTYNWNIVQCLVVIGSARLVLTWAFIWTKNIWVSTGAHIINDWTILGMTIFLAPLAAVSGT
jgi:membrane protease YdiL (CAAX protease family)